MVVMPCNIKHSFHNDCISGWLKTHMACPTCRAEVTLETVEASRIEYKNKFASGGSGVKEITGQIRRINDSSEIFEDKEC